VDAPTSTQHVLEILDPTGDTKVMWDRNNDDEVSIAKAAFDAAIAKGSSVFAVKGKTGEQGKRLKEFDPAIERMIVVPQMVGG
jgi:dihydropteroate synthase